MNQILLTKLAKFKNRIKKYKLLFLVSVLSMFAFFIYFTYTYINSKSNDTLSITLLNNFNIERLYSNKSDYSLIELNRNKDFFIIGSIEIPAIQINYPIISETTDDFLKISPCRFYGPYPNKIGNLCIAAHNYDDDRFFGNINKLNKGDKINIYDSSNYMVSYYIYAKYEVSENDTSCTSQYTNGKREITLVTCNNFNGNRLILKARE